MIPDWAKGAIIYQIFPDRFCNGDKENDVRTGEYYYEPGGDVTFCENWDELPSELDVNRFYGGDLEGIWSKLPYLKKLGVEVIYLNPIFKSPSNHKYDTTDYDEVDPHLTSKHGELSPNEYFAGFVRAIHEAGMKIILDGVFNHCGKENLWLKEHEEYFCREENGEIKYWWGIKTLPKLNYRSKALEDEIIRIGKKWVSPPYNCDGWRLDVAADLGESMEDNHRFWKRFHDEVRNANPNSFIFAEHYGDASPWIESGEWDSVMNYEGFMEPISWFFTGVDKHCDSENKALCGDAATFARTLIDTRKHFTKEAYLSAVNQLDNHDHARYITRTSGRIGRNSNVGGESAADGARTDVLFATVVFQMTWPGSPGIYYGNETALAGWTDPDDRRTFPWGRENYEILDFYEQVIKLHKSSPAFRYGDVEIVHTEGGLIAFLRWFEDEAFLVVINRDEYERDVSVDLKKTGIATKDAALRVFECSQGKYNVGRKEFLLSEGELPIAIKAVSAVVIRL